MYTCLTRIVHGSTLGVCNVMHFLLIACTHTYVASYCMSKLLLVVQLPLTDSYMYVTLVDSDNSPNPIAFL